MKKASGSNVVERVLRRHSPAVESARHKNARGAATSKMSSSSLLPKLGLGIAVESPEESPLLRAEDGRAGTSAAGFPSPRRPADASEDPSDPRARGSRGATVASVALAGCVALAGVVTLASRAGVLPHLIPPRAGALASPSVHSPTASPDLDIPEVFVITGRDADGPTGEWRRVDAATKAQMEAEALKAEHPERKSRTSESTKSEFETSEPGAVEPDVDNPDAVASLSGYFDDEAAALDTSSAEEAQKIADDTRANERREAAARDGVSTARVVEHPATEAQRRELEALKSQQSRFAEIEAQERAWELEQRREARAARGVESGGDVLSGVAAAGDSEKALTFSDGASDWASDPSSFSAQSSPDWSSVDLAAHVDCVSSLRDPDTGDDFDVAARFDPRSAEGDPSADAAAGFGPRARAIRDATFASGFFRVDGVPEDVHARVRAVKDGVCNMGRARLNVVFYADSAETCGFAKALYAAGRDAANRDEPATPRLGAGRFQCRPRPLHALPLQPPRAPLNGETEGTCANAPASAVWYNKVNFVTETADAARRGEAPAASRYAWIDAEQPGPGLIRSLLEHPFDARALATMPTRVHFRCHAENLRRAMAAEPCRSRAQFIAPKLFAGTEEAIRRFKNRWDEYMRHYVPLEGTADGWRRATGWFADYKHLSGEKTPLIQSPIVANGETGAWSCPCPTEEYVMNRLFNDELFPEQRDAPAIEETPVSWGDDEAVATVGRAFALLPGLSLLAREDDAGAIVSTAALGAAATPAERVNNDPARTWDMDPGAAAAAVDAAARLAGQSESVRASYIEQIVDASPRLHASSAAAGVATPTATTTPRLHAEGITPKLVDAESAGEKDEQCARNTERPSGYAELPNMGLTRWRF